MIHAMSVLLFRKAHDAVLETVKKCREIVIDSTRIVHTSSIAVIFPFSGVALFERNKKFIG